MPTQLYSFVITSALLFFTALFSPLQTKALEKAQPFFIPDNNQVKILNQKLEFKATPNGEISIGNILISSANLKMEIEQASTFVFTGPDQFMTDATLIIKDPHGIAIWSDTPSELTKTPEETAATSNLGKNKSLQYRIRNTEDLVTKLKRLEYFNFCLFSESSLHRTQLCTQGLGLSEQDNVLSLVFREKIAAENTIIVNGTQVEDHGIVQFDKKISSVSIAAKLKSGINLDFKIDYLPLELIDLFYDLTKNKIHIKLRVNSASANSTKNSENIWESEIDLNDPYLYIESNGKAPLRQELSVNKDLIPTEADRPILVSGPAKTYLANMHIFIQNKEGQNYTSLNSEDFLTPRENTTDWLIKNKVGHNIHKLESKNSLKTFNYGFNIEKGYSTDTSIGFVSRQSSLKNTVGLKLNINQYWDELEKINLESLNLRLGTHLTYESIDRALRGELSFRLNQNLSYLNSSWSLRFGFTNPGDYTHFGLSYDGPVTQFKSILGDQIEVQLLALPHGHELSTKSRYLFDPSLGIYWGLMNQKLVAQTNNELSLGAVYRF